MSLTLKARTKIFLLFVVIVMGVLAAFNFALFSIADQDWQAKKMELMKSDMHSMLGKEDAKKRLKDVYLTHPDGSVEYRSGVFEKLDSIDGIAPGDVQKVADRYYSILPDKLPDGSIFAVADDVTDVIGTKFDLVSRVRTLSVVMLFVVAAIAFAFTRYLFRPIRQIAGKAEAFDPHDDLDVARIGLDGDPKDEFVVLAHSMDRLFERLIANTGKLEQFSDDIAHELKNRLFEIRSTLELGKRKGTPESSSEQALAQVGSLSELVHKLLMFSRLDDVELSRKPTDIGTLVRSLFPAEGERLAIAGKSKWNVSPELFGTALFNLVGNALKYSKDSVKVRISDASIEIADNGIGIPAENLPFVFDRFYKVDSSREHGTGHGIGLSVAKKIVEAHGFGIRIESEVGKGTKIRIEQ